MFKKVAYCVQALLFIPVLVSTGQVTITLSSGVFYTDNTFSTPLADGSLLMLIASTNDASFGPPIPSAFTSGDDTIVTSWGLDQNTSSVAGADVHQINLGSYPIDLGGGLFLNQSDPFMLRWFPALGTGDAAPVGGEAYGEFRSDSLLDNSTIPWSAPAPAVADVLTFLNPDYFGIGTSAQSLFDADLTVVPEPSTYALIAFGGILILGYSYSRRIRRIN